MSIPYVYQTCRRQSLRRLRRSISQSRAKSTFISLKTGQPEKTSTTNPRTSIADIAEDDRQHVFVTQNKTRRPNAWVPKRTEGDALELLFEESLRPQPTIASIPSIKGPSIEAYERVDQLKQRLISKSVGLEEAWEFFAENLGPEVWRGRDQQIVFPTTLPKASQLLLRKIVAARQGENIPDGIPSFTEVAKTYLEIGIMQPRDWLQMIWVMLKILVRQRDLHNTAISSGSPSRIDETSIEDFLGVWRLFSAAGNPSQWSKFDEATNQGFEFLPFLNSTDMFRARRGRDLDEVFCRLYPAFPKSLRISLAAASILTFDILTTYAPTEIVKLQGGDKLVSALEDVIRLSKITSAELENCFLPNPYADWTKKYVPASILNRCKAEEDASGVMPKRLGNVNMNNRLEQATKKRDLRRVNQLWEEAKYWPPKNSSSHKISEESRVQSNPVRFWLEQPLCNHFILAYTSIRQPERAVQVWNHMITVGLTPNLSTWNAMLEGCKSARDAKSLESVWARLLQSGSIPDAVCWTTRINCLIDSGSIEEGIRALDDMGQIWLKAARRKHKITKDTDRSTIGDVDEYVKPTIATINGAISALARRKRMELAPRLIAWAGNFGISPDVYTYNILLRPLIREGRSEDAQKLLQMMDAEGLKADVITFTTILEESFRSEVPHTPAEQTALINSIFEEMEASGVEANQHTYNTIMYNLLQSCQVHGDMTAVRAVLSRMIHKGLEPSAHINTMLLEHYLSRDPPNLEAARALVNSISSSAAIVDHIFWDRVIEGFSRAHDTNTALTILGKQAKHGHHVGWITLSVLIQALLVNGEEAMARRVMADVKTERGGPCSRNERGAEGQHLFWHIMAENGLISHEEVDI